MSILKSNWESLRKSPLGETIELLEDGFLKFRLDFYLVGAFARDLWLEHVRSILPDKRRTADIDFAIYIEQNAAYEELKDYLVNVLRFNRDRQPYRLISPNGTIVDLLPFGGIEKNDEVFLHGNPPVEFSVLGTKSVTANAEVIAGKFKVITLPGLCVLKLIAFRDKPDARA